MKTAKWTCSLLLTCGLLLLLTGSCSDAPTPPNSSAASRINGVADANFSRDDDDGDDAKEFCPAGGVIATTKTIYKNTKLGCDVKCENIDGPCIQFGAPNITLWLNNHMMTGPAVPPANCAANAGIPWDGISTNGHDRVRVRGPGMVQQFRRHGIFVVQSERAAVQHVTSHFNCFSGILMALSNRNDISDNVSVRNAIASADAPCGGNCIVNSNHNRIHRNSYHGNGASVPPNDFGVGLVGTSTGNDIRDNNIGGNINGVRIASTAMGNSIVRNIIAGNPPVQLSAGSGSPLGADINDLSPANSNEFRENHCVTYIGTTTPPPCPNFSRSRRDHRSGDDH